MKLLEDRIIKDGKIFDNSIIKVDSFLNHKLDINFLKTISKEFYDYFKNRGINKILTIEASGICLATVTSLWFGDIPVVFAKKSKSKNISDDFYVSKVKSYTYDKSNDIIVSKEFLNKEDKLLIIDDFLAEGNAIKGLIDISNNAGCDIKGIGIAVEKGFQNGGSLIRSMGYDLLSLAIIKGIDNGEFRF